MDSILRQKRGAVLAVAERHRLRRVRVFGSAARDDLRDDSDIDILAEFPPGFTLFDHAVVERELGELLGRPVDLVSEAALRPRVRQNVTREAVAL